VVGPDIELRVRFNSRIDRERSRLTLVLPDDTARPLPIAGEARPDMLSARPTGLDRGDYKLRWQVLAVDGHITRGEIPFRVVQGSPSLSLTCAVQRRCDPSG
jgi:methionine-rich copper-binding protein CopC